MYKDLILISFNLKKGNQEMFSGNMTGVWKGLKNKGLVMSAAKERCFREKTRYGLMEDYEHKHIGF